MFLINSQNMVSRVIFSYLYTTKKDIHKTNLGKTGLTTYIKIIY